MRTKGKTVGAVEKKLLLAVRTELQCVPLLRAEALEVGLRAGIVTLRGTVATEWARFTAEQAARRASGGCRVVNELRVNPPEIAGT